MRKRIAVLVAQIDEATQNRFLTEFIKQAYAYDYDVCIFSMYQKYQDTVLRNVGDSSVFKLLNYELFEAILILSDTLLTPGLALPLQEKIKREFSGPVLVVDQESPYFESVKQDHYTPVKNIVDHLIEVHGYKEIGFLGGKEGHPHSVQRYNAYLDSMKEHGIPVREEWVYHGNYWYDSGDDFAYKLLADRKNMPRAVACANDCMAIGLASILVENGIRVPEDIAITGYDSIDDGKHSPVPITSADIPAGECGQYCMQWLHSKINEVELAPFVSKAPICIGGSCGCEHKTEMVPKELRSSWSTKQSSRSMFSDFNHVVEDMFAQNDFMEFLETLRHYIFQIKPFYTFDMCLNEDFLNPIHFVGENAYGDSYTEKVYRVLGCGAKRGEGIIDLEDSFHSKDIIPEFNNERSYPTTYIVNPLYFDDRCFGYTVLNHGPKIMLYDRGYRVWMRNLMQGMEAFYRQKFMYDLIERIKSDQVRDTMTGLYNYEGFIKNSSHLIEGQNDDRKISILTIDIKGMKLINEIYGREAGERAIRAVSRVMLNTVAEDEVCCRMCNDEFLMALHDDEAESRSKEVTELLHKELADYKLVDNTDYQLQVHIANLLGSPADAGEMELLVNSAISVKNHVKKVPEQKSSTETKEAMEEIKYNHIVMKILNDNLLTYHYQPIVSAKDGTVFAYEALMRAQNGEVNPFQILQAATYMGRLKDVESATLLNVTADVEENINKFGDAKVFMNSLPGVDISKRDDEKFCERIRNNPDRFVVEFTEESELDDKKLKKLKAKYEKLGNQIALDDYGAGYSNVNNLLRYMPNYVKIDRMLISEIHDNPQKQHMVKSIIDYSHDNNIVALAEGVETREELQECIRLGADLIQGYYTGRPAREPISEIDIEIVREIKRFNDNRTWGI